MASKRPREDEQSAELLRWAKLESDQELDRSKLEGAQELERLRVELRLEADWLEAKRNPPTPTLKFPDLLTRLGVDPTKPLAMPEYDGLVCEIGLRNIELPVKALTDAITELWALRGSKEDKSFFSCPVTVAVGGGGKTQFVKHLQRDTPFRDAMLAITGAKHLLVFSAGFNSQTNYVRSKDLSFECATFSRFLAGAAGTTVLDQASCLRCAETANFPTFAAACRSAFFPGEPEDKVAVVLLIDEIAKLPDKFRKGLMDELNGFVESEIGHGRPTFSLVTGLEVTWFFKHVETLSKRKLFPIPLSPLQDETE